MPRSCRALESASESVLLCTLGLCPPWSQPPATGRRTEFLIPMLSCSGEVSRYARISLGAEPTGNCGGLLPCFIFSPGGFTATLSVTENFPTVKARTPHGWWGRRGSARYLYVARRVKDRSGKKCFWFVVGRASCCVTSVRESKLQFHARALRASMFFFLSLEFKISLFA